MSAAREKPAPKQEAKFDYEGLRLLRALYELSLCPALEAEEQNRVDALFSDVCQRFGFDKRTAELLLERFSEGAP